MIKRKNLMLTAKQAMSQEEKEVLTNKGKTEHALKWEVISWSEREGKLNPFQITRKAKET